MLPLTRAAVKRWLVKAGDTIVSAGSVFVFGESVLTFPKTTV